MRLSCCLATEDHTDQLRQPRSHRGGLTRLPEAAACDFGDLIRLVSLGHVAALTIQQGEGLSPYCTNYV
jgi:hypothetical protein